MKVENRMKNEAKTLNQHQLEAAELLGDDLKHPRLGATLGLVEELGELVKEVMELEIYQQAEARQHLGDEMADVLFSLFEVCTAYNLSLEEVYERKVAKIRAKRDEWRDKYSQGLREVRAKLD